jgi:hypothetical protein
MVPIARRIEPVIDSQMREISDTIQSGVGLIELGTCLFTDIDSVPVRSG